MGLAPYETKIALTDRYVVDDTYVPGTIITIDGEYGYPLILLACIVATNDTVPHDFVLYHSNSAGTNAAPVASITIPSGAGFGPIPAADVLLGNPLPLNGGVVIMGNDYLAYSLPVAPSAGTIVTMYVLFGTL